MPTLKDLYKRKAEVIALAESDSSFRNQLETDPKTAIENLYPAQGELPADLTITIVKDSDQEIFINLVPDLYDEEKY